MKKKKPLYTDDENINIDIFILDDVLDRVANRYLETKTKSKSISKNKKKRRKKK